MRPMRSSSSRTASRSDSTFSPYVTATARDIALEVIEALPAALHEAHRALADDIVERLRRADARG